MSLSRKTFLNRGKSRILTILISIGIVVILYTAGISLSDSPISVDIGAISDGTDYNYKWSLYQASGLDFTNLSEGYVLLTFSNGSGSYLKYNGKDIGVLDQNYDTSFILHTSSSGSETVRFQAVSNMEVDITWYNSTSWSLPIQWNDADEAEVPGGGLYVYGFTSKIGYRYSAGFKFEGSNAYGLNITTGSSVETVGMVDDMISRFSWGNSDFNLRSSSNDSSLILFSKTAQSFTSKIIQVTYVNNNITTPENANSSVSWNNGVAEIQVTASEMSYWQNNTYLPSSISVLANVLRGYSVEQDTNPPNFSNITTYYHDIELEFRNATVILVNGDTKLNVSGTYEIIYSNESNSTNSYPPGPPVNLFTVQDKVVPIDNDNDGFPSITFWSHNVDITINPYPTANTYTIYPSSSTTPDLLGGTQPDSVDNMPNSPNLASDLDNEELSNLIEIKLFGSDPFDSDTDGDSISDKVEFISNSFSDTDDDGLEDNIEGDLGTSTTNRDSDSDNFEDGAEYSFWNYYLNTGPTADVDNDNKKNILDSHSDIDSSNPYYNYDLDMDALEYLSLGTNLTIRDTDGDSSQGSGLSDGYEAWKWYNDVEIHYLSNSDNDSLPNIFDSDSDDDGVNDWDEWNLWSDLQENTSFYNRGGETWSSDPTKVHSDNDGITDYYEIKVYITNPSDEDSDGDNLSDPLELSLDGSGDLDSLLTNPRVNDTDFDGLEDGEEDSNLDGAINTTETDPNTWDSDGDTLGDGFETNYPTILDPLTPNNPLLDDDSDGITTYGEMLNYTSPISNDTDSDQMDDKWEIDNLTNPLIDDSELDYDFDNLTNLDEYLGWDIDVHRFSGINTTVPLTQYHVQSYPRFADVDSDGVMDYNEKKYLLDPRMNDTDLDGFWDLYELFQPEWWIPTNEQDARAAQRIYYDYHPYGGWAVTDVFCSNNGSIYFTLANTSSGEGKLKVIYSGTNNSVELWHYSYGRFKALTGDSEGYLYILKGNSIYKYGIIGTDSSNDGTLVTGLNNATDIAINHNQELFIAEEGSNNLPENININGTWSGTSSIKKWNESSGLSTILTGLNRTKSIALDNSNRLFISEFGVVQRNTTPVWTSYLNINPQLICYDIEEGTSTIILNQAYTKSLNFDKPGDLYYVDIIHTSPETPTDEIDGWMTRDTTRRIRTLSFAQFGGNPNFVNGTTVGGKTNLSKIIYGPEVVFPFQGQLFYSIEHTWFPAEMGLFSTNVTSYSNATNWDTDGDGLPDGIEIYGWNIPWDNNITYTSNVLNKDTDKDLLWDCSEYENYTNPRNNDTDYDLVSDYVELTGYFGIDLIEVGRAAITFNNSIHSNDFQLSNNFPYNISDTFIFMHGNSQSNITNSSFNINYNIHANATYKLTFYVYAFINYTYEYNNLSYNVGDNISSFILTLLDYNNSNPSISTQITDYNIINETTYESGDESIGVKYISYSTNLDINQGKFNVSIEYNINNYTIPQLLFDKIRIDRKILDPLDEDTDNDDIIDGYEVLFNFYPLNPDTDMDGIIDGGEVQYNDTGIPINYTHALNPDIDDDNFIDGQDLEPGFSYTPKWHVKNWQLPKHSQSYGLSLWTDSFVPPYTVGNISNNDGYNWSVKDVKIRNARGQGESRIYNWFVSWWNEEPIVYAQQNAFNFTWLTEPNNLNHLKLQLTIDEEHDRVGDFTNETGNYSWLLAFGYEMSHNGTVTESGYNIVKPVGTHSYVYELTLDAANVSYDNYTIEFLPVWVTIKIYDNGTYEPFSSEELETEGLIIAGTEKQVHRNITRTFYKPYVNTTIFNTTDYSTIVETGLYNFSHNWTDYNGSFYNNITAFVVNNITYGNFYDKFDTINEIANNGSYNGINVDILIVNGGSFKQHDYIDDNIKWNDPWLIPEIIELKDIIDIYDIDYSSIQLHTPTYSSFALSVFTNEKVWNAFTRRVINVAGYVSGKLVYKNSININAVYSPAGYDWFTADELSRMHKVKNPQGYTGKDVYVKSNVNIRTSYYEAAYQPPEWEGSGLKKYIRYQQDSKWKSSFDSDKLDDFVKSSRGKKLIAKGGATLAIAGTAFAVKDDLSNLINDKDYYLLPRILLNISSGFFFSMSALFDANIGLRFAHTLRIIKHAEDVNTLRMGGLGWKPSAAYHELGTKASARAAAIGFICLAILEVGFAVHAAWNGDMDLAKNHTIEAAGYAIDAAICWGIPGWGLLAEGIVFLITGGLALIGVIDRPYTIGTGIMALTGFATGWW